MMVTPGTDGNSGVPFGASAFVVASNTASVPDTMNTRSPPGVTARRPLLPPTGSDTRIGPAAGSPPRREDPRIGPAAGSLTSAGSTTWNKPAVPSAYRRSPLGDSAMLDGSSP